MSSIIKLEGRWSKEEGKLFLESHLALYNDWKLIQEHIQTRSLKQIRSHSQKFHKRLKNNFKIKNYSLYNEVDKEKQKEHLVNCCFYELLNQVDHVILLKLANQAGVYLSNQFKLFLDELQNTWNELTDSVNQITQKI